MLAISLRRGANGAGVLVLGGDHILQGIDGDQAAGLPIQSPRWAAERRAPRSAQSPLQIGFPANTQREAHFGPALSVGKLIYRSMSRLGPWF
ncbi:hypothetical protein CYJ73_25050 [Gordonia terrae]|uniref:Uncharacterized protein n=1 Tax=Gordonia terrae TaxID=2055 RepID=A0A2I1R0X7_9ACTN|nr:hypothetical protein CYJ73_25050 [Gordonia terrae]